MVDILEVPVNRTVCRLLLHDESEGAGAVRNVYRAAARNLALGWAWREHDVDDLRDEGIAFAIVRCIEGTHRRREVRRVGLARDVGVLQGVDGDGEAIFEVATAKVGGVDQWRRTGRVQLRREGIAAATERRVEGPGSRREIR